MGAQRQTIDNRLLNDQVRLDFGRSVDNLGHRVKSGTFDWWKTRDDGQINEKVNIEANFNAIYNFTIKKGLPDGKQR